MEKATEILINNLFLGLTDERKQTQQCIESVRLLSTDVQSMVGELKSVVTMVKDHEETVNQCVDGYKEMSTRFRIWGRVFVVSLTLMSAVGGTAFSIGYNKYNEQINANEIQKENTDLQKATLEKLQDIESKM